MILISHRGNIDGKQTNLENNPNYVDNAINLGYDVEIDVWLFNSEFYLGHDEPQFLISFDWLEKRKNKIWIHCKNLDCVSFLNDYNKDFNYFWHQTDDLTLTSFGYMWVYPGKQPIKNSISVLPEINNDNVSKCIGICSDVILKFNSNKIF
jgi:hypothetical protein